MWREHLKCSKRVFAVVRGPTKLWDPKTQQVLICCVIMHNMIMKVEDEDDVKGLEFKNMGSSMKI